MLIVRALSSNAVLTPTSEGHRFQRAPAVLARMVRRTLAGLFVSLLLSSAITVLTHSSKRLSMTTGACMWLSSAPVRICPRLCTLSMPRNAHTRFADYCMLPAPSSFFAALSSTDYASVLRRLFAHRHDKSRTVRHLEFDGGLQSRTFLLTPASSLTSPATLRRLNSIRRGTRLRCGKATSGQQDANAPCCLCDDVPRFDRVIALPSVFVLVHNAKRP